MTRVQTIVVDTAPSSSIPRWGHYLAIALIAAGAFGFLLQQLPSYDCQTAFGLKHPWLCWVMSRLRSPWVGWWLIGSALGAATLWTAAAWRRDSAPLLATAPLVPIAASVCAVLMFVAQGASVAAPISGVVLALALWCLTADACANSLTAQRCNQSSYGELMERCTQLRSHLEMVGSDEAQAEYDAMEKDLKEAGLPWVRATGYINLWKRLHRAEEALIDKLPEPVVIAGAIHDELRLIGSQMESRADLLAKLRTAVVTLEPNAMSYLTLSADEATALQTHITPPGPHPKARSILRTVRRTINEYQDERYDGFVEQRNLIWGTSTVVGGMLFILLAIAMNLTEKTEAIVGGVVFFLVGATIGLLARMREEFSTQQDIGEYGTSNARLFATPLFSGLVAVFGVVLLEAVKSTPGGIRLESVFTLGADAETLQRLLAAAIFGLTPELLFSRLQEQSESYKGQIKQVQASAGAAGA